MGTDWVPGFTSGACRGSTSSSVSSHKFTVNADPPTFPDYTEAYYSRENTISLWTRFHANTTGDAYIFSARPSSSSSGLVIYQAANSSSALAFYFYNGSTLVKTISIQKTTVDIEDKFWHHIAVTVYPDPSNPSADATSRTAYAQIFIDGSLITTQSIGTSITNLNLPGIFYGVGYSLYSPCISSTDSYTKTDFAVDNVMVYNERLSQKRIYELSRGLAFKFNLDCKYLAYASGSNSDVDVDCVKGGIIYNGFLGSNSSFTASGINSVATSGSNPIGHSRYINGDHTFTIGTPGMYASVNSESSTTKLRVPAHFVVDDPTAVGTEFTITYWFKADTLSSGDRSTFFSAGDPEGYISEYFTYGGFSHYIGTIDDDIISFLTISGGESETSYANCYDTRTGPIPLEGGKWYFCFISAKCGSSLKTGVFEFGESLSYTNTNRFISLNFDDISYTIKDRDDMTIGSACGVSLFGTYTASILGNTLDTKDGNALINSSGSKYHMSDLRIYHKYLSTQDIFDIFSSPAAIDDNGNIYSRNFIEE